MNKDVVILIKDSASTFLNIGQMTQYRMKYLQEIDAEASMLLRIGHEEKKSECSGNYGVPSCIKL